jgi:hypothetical protein
MSQIYNSLRKYFDDVNRDRKDRAKILTAPVSGNQDGGKQFMPPCPIASR